jgi:hypothetical protein
MGGWYWIGVLAGLGSSIGLLGGGILPRRVTALAAALVAAAIGIALFGWAEALGGLAGGVSGGLGAVPVVRGARRRGGTRGGLVALISLGALVTAALAFVPVLGYLEAIAVPGLGLRLRAREPDRHAGLRILARD